MSNSRVPDKDSDLLQYFIRTIAYLIKRFKDDIVRTVAASTTENLLEAALPANMKIEVKNTGAPGAPDLYFCLAPGDSADCDPLTAVTVAQGASKTIFVKELGASGLIALNVTNTDATLPSSCQVVFPRNYERLGLLEEIAILWKNFGQLFTEKYNDSQDPSKATKTVTDDKNAIKAQFTTFAESPLKTIEGSLNIIDEDRNTFNIKKPDHTGTRPHIEVAPFTGMVPMEACSAKLRHTTQHDASRASIHADADGAETRYVVLDLDAPPPNSAADCPNVEFSTKAIHILTPEDGVAGKRLHTFTRWRNNTDEEKSGPYGLRLSIVLID